MRVDERKIKEILERVLAKIRPSDEERERINSVVTSVLENLKDVEGKATVQGSYAKDTWLSGNMDVDVFILLDREDVDYEEFIERVREVLGGKWIKRYAQHPFLEGYVEGVKFNIVPAHDIKKTGRLISPVDRTPLHTEYVKKHKELADDIRLIKAMAKAMGFYGSEIKIKGFSGYLLEVLTIHYGGFLPLIKATDQWHPFYVIDTMRYYSKEEWKELIEKFKPSPFIVIDPVDKNRNCAAAVSIERLADMVLTASLFRMYPSEMYFFKPRYKITRNEGKRLMELRGETFYGILMERPDVVDDRLWGELHRGKKILRKFLGDLRLKCDVMPFANEKHIGYFISVKNEKIETRTGPSAWGTRKNRFIQKYLGSRFGPWFAEQKESIIVARECDKCSSHARVMKRLERLSELPFSKDIAQVVPTAKILVGEKVFTLLDEFPEELFQFTTKKKPYIVVAEKLRGDTGS